jgi:membrane-associated protein
MGAVLWIWSMTAIGFFLGSYIPGIDQHIEIVVIIVVFISLLPGIISWYRGKRARRYDTSSGSKPAPTEM